MRTQHHDGHHLVSVTSAMRYIKTVLGEPEDSYGPAALSKVHCAEGEACHRVCLDWLALEHEWLPSMTVPARDPAVHPDQVRWQNVLANAQRGFQEFCQEYLVEPVGIEQEVVSKPFGLVGHVDLICRMQWKGKRILAIVDLKFTSSIMESHRLQVKCYHHCEGLRKAHLGILFHSDRNTGIWRVVPVDLSNGLEDVMAVSCAAKLYVWNEKKQGRA